MTAIKINGKETEVPEGAIAIDTDNGQWIYNDNVLSNCEIESPGSIVRPTNGYVQTVTIPRTTREPRMKGETMTAATTQIRFNKYHVTDGQHKAKVFYSLDNRVDGRKCVTIYAKDFGSGLGRIFADEYQNDTDSMTDYFDEGRVVLFEDHPLYVVARKRVEGLQS